MERFAAGLLLVFLLLPLGGRLAAQDAAPERFTLKIAVMGPGDELYFWWGHIALVIEDNNTGTARFYDYGLFSFKNAHFYTNFAMGRLLYSCGASPAQRNYDAYIQNNRDITLYTLNVSPAQIETVRNFAEYNILPEHRDYYYHHFKDNCATRIRDIIDLAVDGQFKAAFGDAPGRFTLRQHVRRHTWFSPFADWALNYLMGQVIDRPITIWEEMFLPAEIGRRISDFTYVDEAGTTRQLVSSVVSLNQAKNRPAVLAAPRKQWVYELIVGLLIAGALAYADHARRTRPKRWNVVFFVGQGALGLFFGVMGVILFFMTFFTNHDYTFENCNALYTHPLLLAALPLCVMALWNKLPAKRVLAERLLRALWTCVIVGGVLSMAIKITPSFYQQNQVTQALVLPFALVLSCVPTWCRRLLRGKAASPST
jgi:hypothetical protein